MTEEKSCYNCENKNCNVYYSTVKKDYKRHFEVYEYQDFDCVNHDKWEESKVKEIRTDNKETLKNALKRIAELEALIKSEHEIEARKNNSLVSRVTKEELLKISREKHIAKLEKENEMLKRHCMKFSPNTMIEFGAYVLYYTANPESKRDIPNCVYEKVEKMYAELHKAEQFISEVEK